MPDEFVNAVADVLEDLRRQVVEAVADLDDEDVNRRFPGLRNTVGILLRHIAGSERYWVQGIVGGATVLRHRDAEFGSDRLEKAVLLATLRTVGEESARVLAQVTPERLAGTVRVERAGGSAEVTRAWALLHAVQHLAYHLGQIRQLAALARHARAATPAS
jgi:uncharacterized damage-inducible protein DinB